MRTKFGLLVAGLALTGAVIYGQSQGQTGSQQPTQPATPTDRSDVRPNAGQTGSTAGQDRTTGTGQGTGQTGTGTGTGQTGTGTDRTGTGTGQTGTGTGIGTEGTGTGTGRNHMMKS
jgi:hypothetical protein